MLQFFFFCEFIVYFIVYLKLTIATANFLSKIIFFSSHFSQIWKHNKKKQQYLSLDSSESLSYFLVLDVWDAVGCCTNICFSSSSPALAIFTTEKGLSFWSTNIEFRKSNTDFPSTMRPTTTLLLIFCFFLGRICQDGRCCLIFTRQDVALAEYKQRIDLH